MPTKPKSWMKKAFHEALTHYYLHPSSQQTAADFGVARPTLVSWLYGENPIPKSAILKLQMLLPKLAADTEKRIQKKIDKLIAYQKLIQEYKISDENTLKAIRKDLEKNEKAQKEDEKLIFQKNRSAQSAEKKNELLFSTITNSKAADLPPELLHPDDLSPEEN